MSVRKFIAIATGVLALGLVAWRAQAAGQGDDGAGDPWVRMTHEEFLALFEEHPEGFTLYFFDASEEGIAREFHASDQSVFLDDYWSGALSVGTIDYAPGQQFCYDYSTEVLPACWHYFRSSRGYREESVDTDTADFFQVEPGNTFARQWGEDWRGRFEAQNQGFGG